MASFGLRTLEASLNAWLVLGVGLATRCSGVWTLALGVAASRNVSGNRAPLWWKAGNEEG